MYRRPNCGPRSYVTLPESTTACNSRSLTGSPEVATTCNKLPRYQVMQSADSAEPLFLHLMHIRLSHTWFSQVPLARLGDRLCLTRINPPGRHFRAKPLVPVEPRRMHPAGSRPLDMRVITMQVGTSARPGPRYKRHTRIVVSHRQVIQHLTTILQLRPADWWIRRGLWNR